jgi:virginiamycin B lyase
MTLRRNLVLIAFGLLALAIAACSGGGSVSYGGSSTLPKTPSASPNTVGNVTVRVTIPSAATASARLKRRMNEAQNTQGLVVNVYPSPGSTSAPAQTDAFDTSSSSSYCTTNTDGSRSCTFPIVVTAGSYDFTFESYDMAPVSGQIPGGAHALGFGNDDATVTASATTSLNVIINGIAALPGIELPVPIVHTLESLTQQAVVSVLDADDNVIVANSYVDANGNPVTVSFSSSSALVTVSPASITGPQPVTATWNPSGITAAQLTSGVFPAITETLSTGGSAQATMTAPAAVATFINAATALSGNIAVAGSSLWAPEITNPSHLLTQTPGGSGNVYAVPSPGVIGTTAVPNDVVQGPDGNIYFTLSNSAAVGRMTTTGSNEQGIGLTADATGIAADGTYVWATEPTNNAIAQITVTPSLSVFEQTLGPASPTAIVKGPDNNMYFTEGSYGIGEINDSLVLFGPYASNLPGSAMCSDGASAVWYPLSGSAMLAKFNVTTDTPTYYSISPAIAATCTLGPDGNIWFTYDTPTPGFGRISTSGTGLALFPLAAGSNPQGIVALNGMLFVVDRANNAILAIQP